MFLDKHVYVPLQSVILGGKMGALKRLTQGNHGEDVEIMLYASSAVQRRRPLEVASFGLLVASFVVLSLGFGVEAASASLPTPVWDGCTSGSDAGQCNIPRGIGVNSENGRVFVSDQENHRIDEFTAWGEFVKAWGWDVVVSGPGDDTTPPEDQFEICVPKHGDSCKAGTKGSGDGQFGAEGQQ